MINDLKDFIREQITNTETCIEDLLADFADAANEVVQEEKESKIKESQVSLKLEEASKALVEAAKLMYPDANIDKEILFLLSADTLKFFIHSGVAMLKGNGSIVNPLLDMLEAELKLDDEEDNDDPEIDVTIIENGERKKNAEEAIKNWIKNNII